MRLNENALKVLERRYFAKDENGKLLEDAEGMFRRIAEAVAKADESYVSQGELKNIINDFYDLISNLYFLPNSPTLMNAGRPLGQLSACFVLPVEDTMEGIFETIKNAALIHKSGGGTGFSFSRLRAKGATVNTTGGVASGPISFMKVFNAATEAVKQGGTRRGANMGILRVDHPDILEFITCKKDNSEITNFNISVGITEKFMEAAAKNQDYELIDPHSGKIAGSLNASEVFDLIIDMAWNNGEPGIIFLDRLNNENVTPELGRIESTNPCIKGDSWVLTNGGPVQVNDIIGKEVSLALNGSFYRSDKKGFFCTGKKEVIKICTNRGYELTLTKDHLVRSVKSLSRFNIIEEWKAAGDIKSGDLIVLSNNRGVAWEGRGSYNEGFLLGLLIGDGTLKKEGAIISIWGGEQEAESLLRAAGEAAYTLPHRDDFNGFQAVISDRKEHRIRMSALRDLAEDYGIMPGNKSLTPEIEKTSFEFHKGFLRGIFDTDGTVVGNQKKGVSIRLWQNNVESLQSIQRMLHRMGIASTIYLNRKCESIKSLPDGKGGSKNYLVKSGHELVISGDNMHIFYNIIGFSSCKKQSRISDALDKYKRTMNRERFVAIVTESLDMGKCDVFDIQVPGINAFDSNGIYIHNCGEQPLLPYEACNLGSINLNMMLRKTDDKYEIDYKTLKNTVARSVHFLDNVIDVNKYPLPEIDKMTRGTRKIGLGVMGWADMLCMLGIPYNSQQAVELAEKLMSFIQTEAMKTSAELAKQKGVFPYYDKSIYKEKNMEVRNATTTTIAPTGTLSIIAGVSSGIEPLFAISYIRNVMDNEELVEVNPIFKAVAEERGFYSEDLMKRIAKKGSIHDFDEIPEDVRAVFVTAHDISPEWHVKMQAAFQKFTDNAVSKTVNLSNEATRDDVKDVFVLADKLKCKGVTIYRDGSRDLQVLNIGKVKGKEKNTDKINDESIVKNEHNNSENDILDQLSEGMNSCAQCNIIEPRPRPDITTGFTEKVKIGCGNLYVTVNYDKKGICEVFTNTGRAGGCPSQSEATSRLVSIALRSGIDAKSIVEQLKGIRCPSTIRQRGLKVMSCPDAIGRLIEKVAKIHSGDDEAIIGSAPEIDDSMIQKPGAKLVSHFSDGKRAGNDVEMADEISEVNNKGFCPECGKKMEHEGGCVICRNCGYSKCG